MHDLQLGGQALRLNGAFQLKTVCFNHSYYFYRL